MGPGEVSSTNNQRRMYIMKLSEPKVITWWIAVAFGVVGILAHLVTIPVLSPYAFWLVAIGFVILAVATYLKDL
jgi:threonine/homoserine/homoserine lactone efflux protein